MLAFRDPDNIQLEFFWRATNDTDTPAARGINPGQQAPC
jgi:hypothetical protein